MASEASIGIYLDVCCLNRPFDDQSQERVRLEAEAILFVLQRCQSGMWQWISSEAVEWEIEDTQNLERRSQVESVLQWVKTLHIINEENLLRMDELEALGFSSLDALHLACAEQQKASILLTTDDKFLRKAKRYRKKLKVSIENPIVWILDMRSKEE